MPTDSRRRRMLLMLVICRVVLPRVRRTLLLLLLLRRLLIVRGTPLRLVVSAYVVTVSRRLRSLRRPLGLGSVVVERWNAAAHAGVHCAIRRRLSAHVGSGRDRSTTIVSCSSVNIRVLRYAVLPRIPTVLLLLLLQAVYNPRQSRFRRLDDVRSCVRVSVSDCEVVAETIAVFAGGSASAALPPASRLLASSTRAARSPVGPPTPSLSLNPSDRLHERSLAAAPATSLPLGRARVSLASSSTSRGSLDHLQHSVRKTRTLDFFTVGPRGPRVICSQRCASPAAARFCCLRALCGCRALPRRQTDTVPF